MRSHMYLAWDFQSTVHYIRHTGLEASLSNGKRVYRVSFGKVQNEYLAFAIICRLGKLKFLIFGSKPFKKLKVCNLQMMENANRRLEMLLTLA